MSWKDGSNGLRSALLPEEILPATIRLINRELLPGASPKTQRVLGKVTRILEQAQRTVKRKHRRRVVALEAPATEPSHEAPEDRRQWGIRLRLRRESAHLTRARLAALSGVSASTIRNMETGRHKPTFLIMSRLREVPSLGFSPDREALASVARGQLSDETFPAHGWYAPEFDALEQTREISRRLNGSGGRLEPWMFYTEPAGAAAWLGVQAQSPQAEWPFMELAKAITDIAGNDRLDVLALGCGDAQSEVALTWALSLSAHAPLRLVLLDLSLAMLAAGQKRARTLLDDSDRVRVATAAADFCNLASYRSLLDVRRRRVVCLLGQTVEALDNEILTLRSSLAGMRDGDLLLLDVPVAAALKESRSEIAAREPWLSSPPLSLAERSPRVDFLFGPILSNVRDVKSAVLLPGLDPGASFVARSYAVELRAHIRTKTGRERVFSLGYRKRYALDELVRVLAREGWQRAAQWDAMAGEQQRALLLLEKRSSA